MRRLLVFLLALGVAAPLMERPACLSDNSDVSIKLYLKSGRTHAGSWEAKVRVEHNRFDLQERQPLGVDVTQDISHLSPLDDGNVSVIATIVTPLSSDVFNEPHPAGVVEYITIPSIGNYSFHSEIVDWHKAKHICEKEKAHLAVINSPEEAQALVNIFNRFPYVQSISYLNRQAYLGVSDIATEDTFVTVLGGSLKDAGYEKWSKGEPNNHQGDEDCVSMWRTGELNDVPCSTLLAFICEKKEEKTSNTSPDARH